LTVPLRHPLVAFVGLLAALVLALLIAAPHGQPAAAPGPGDRGFARALEVKERHTERLLARPGIVGTAVGANAAGTPIVRVYTMHAGVSVKSKLNGVDVAASVTGPITAAHHRDGHGGGPPGGGGGGGDDGNGGNGEDPPPPSEPSRTDWWERPVPIGISTGRADECAAGTIGARVSDGDGNTYALSNNHVYAKENAGKAGDVILQPGRYDLNCAEAGETHRLGELARFVEIQFDGTDNVVDAALAQTTVDDLRTSTPLDGYGSPTQQPALAKVGETVQKYGRTTGLTSGQVDGVNASLNVGFSSGTARFVNQIVVRSRPGFIRAGDSGSLLVNSGLDPVGLLFAGDSPGRYGIANPIGAVLDELGDEVGATLTIDGQ
jgi:hypothetical protein